MQCPFLNAEINIYGHFKVTHTVNFTIFTVPNNILGFLLFSDLRWQTNWEHEILREYLWRKLFTIKWIFKLYDK